MRLVRPDLLAITGIPVDTEDLEVIDPPIGLEASQLARLEGLESLSLSFRASDPGSTLRGLRNLPSLVSLQVESPVPFSLPGLSRVLHLDVSAPIAPGWLEALREFPNLRSLRVGDMGITPGSRLNDLHLRESVSRLTHLEALFLRTDARSDVTLSGLQSLTAIEHLRELTVHIFGSESRLEILGGFASAFTELELLALSMPVSDACVEGFSKLADLTELCLFDCQLLTDSGSAHLLGLQRLQHLHLERAFLLTDRFLAAGSWPDLRTMTAKGGEFSSRTASEFVVAHPNCKVDVSDPGTDD